MTGAQDSGKAPSNMFQNSLVLRRSWTKVNQLIFLKSKSKDIWQNKHPNEKAFIKSEGEKANILGQRE